MPVVEDLPDHTSTITLGEFDRLEKMDSKIKMVFLQLNRHLGDIHYVRIRKAKQLFPNAEIQLLLDNAKPGYYDMHLGTRYSYVLPQAISILSKDLITSAIN
jgi:hypothetical protein